MAQFRLQRVRIAPQELIQLGDRVLVHFAFLANTVCWHRHVLSVLLVHTHRRLVPLGAVYWIKHAMQDSIVLRWGGIVVKSIT